MVKLRVWWKSTFPGNAFYFPVNSLLEAKLLLTALPEYDWFLYDNHLRGNYSNAGGLQMWNESTQEWEEWWDDENRDIVDFSLEELRLQDNER
jgi:hypothetical protein